MKKDCVEKRMQMQISTRDSKTRVVDPNPLPLLGSLMEILRTETSLFVEGLEWLLVEGLQCLLQNSLTGSRVAWKRECRCSSVPRLKTRLLHLSLYLF